MKFNFNKEQFYKLLIFSTEQLSKSVKEKFKIFQSYYYIVSPKEHYYNYTNVDITEKNKFESITIYGNSSYITIKADKNYQQITIISSTEAVVVKEEFQKFMAKTFGKSYIKHLTDLANKKYEKGMAKLLKAKASLDEERSKTLFEIKKLQPSNEITK